MKRLSVGVLSVTLALFLVNSFAQKDKDAAKLRLDKQELLNTVFKSTDGGQTWQDIGKGLPETLLKDGIRGDSILANEKGLFLRVGNEMYHSEPTATTSFWTKEILPESEPRIFGTHSGIAPGKPKIVADSHWAVNLKKRNGTSIWSPLFNYTYEPRIRSTFETASGIVFVGTDEGYFRTADDGKTWKHVYVGGYAGHLAEADGVLLATGMKRILRSTDNGKNWALVQTDTSVVFDVKRIKGGFAAMTSTSVSSPRGIKISYDAGLTWQGSNEENKAVIDATALTWNDRPRMKAFMTSIRQVGKDLVCVHNEGIFKSSDQGKTWKLMLPSVGDKGFSLFNSGNVIYAIPSKGGC